MELVVKHFSELTAEELFEIYKLRVSVFIVEQNCPYQDITDVDKQSYHLWLKDEDGIVAYARAMAPGVTFEDASVGRIIAVKRRCGMGTRIVNEAVRIARERCNGTDITIEAQVYARGLYEKCGFRQISEPFLDDGIPHILMKLEMAREQVP